MPNETIRILKKEVLLGAILLTITLMEICWSMGDFSERISRGFLDCSFLESAYLMSIMIAVCLTIVLLLLSLIKKIYSKSAIKLLFLIPVWVFWNYTVFNDRKSSWSFYAIENEFLYSLSLFIVFISVVSITVLLAINCISKIKKA